MKLASLSPDLRVAQRMCGMTLVEMMVSCGVGFLVLLLIGVIFLSSLRSFADMGNYMVMDQASRNALDQMTRDIRRAKNLTAFATNALTFDYNGGTNLYYSYDAASGTLSQFKTGSTTNILLTECDSLAFTMFKNIPLSGGTNETTTAPAQGKAISVVWKCSRTMLGKKLTTEDMEQGLIVIRNKKVN